MKLFSLLAFLAFFTLAATPENYGSTASSFQIEVSGDTAYGVHELSEIRYD